jgi:hypothetical protein
MDNQPLIEQMYARLLGRAADADGLAYWNGLLGSGAVSVAGLVDAFLASREFRDVILPVVQLYELAFQRTPDIDGLAYWASQAQSGASLAQIGAAIAGSREFHARFPALVDPAASLSAMAAKAGAPDALDARDYLLSFLPNALAGGSMGGGSTAIDAVAPVLLSSTPSPNASNASRQVIELVFDEDIMLGDGIIRITNGTTQVLLNNGQRHVHVVGATDERVLPNAGSVFVSDKTLRISLDQMLAPGAKYSLILGDGAVLDLAGNSFKGLMHSNAFSFTASTQTDFTSPAATSASYTQSGQFGAGEVITLSIHFNEAVTVTGTPVLRVDTGPQDRNATYQSGSGTNTLTFSYVVQPGDNTGSFGLSGDLTALREGLSGELTDLLGNVLDNAHVTFNTLSYAGYGYGSPVIELDTAGPAAPALPILVTDTGVVGDNTTNATTPGIRGNAEAGGLVRLYKMTEEGPVLLGDTVANGSGDWSISPALEHGTYQLFATVRDAALNSSLNSPTLTVTVDTQAEPMPAAPRMVVGDNTGSTSDAITSKSNPEISGDAVNADATVLLYKGNGKVDQSVLIGQQEAGDNGTWSIVPTGLGAGVHGLFLVLRDRAGNLSEPSSLYTLTIDATAPAAPTINSMLSAGDSGRISDDRITKLTAQTLTGAGGLANGKVQLFDGANSLGLFDVNPDGSWSANVTLGSTQGSHVITAITFAVSGTPSPASAGFTITLDTIGPETAPGAIDLLAAYDSGAASDDNISSNTIPTFAGTAPESGARVELRTAEDELIGDGIVASDLSWEIALKAALNTDKTWQLTAYWYDLAGNRSAGSAPFSYTLDRAGPEEQFTQSGTNASAAITIPFDEPISWLTGDLIVTSGLSESTISRSLITIGSDNRSMTIPANTFAAGAESTLRLPATLTDLAGNAYNDGNIVLDFLAPALVSTSPANQGEYTGIIALTFNEAIAFADAGSISLRKNGAQEDIYTFTKSSGNWEISNNTISFVGLTLDTGVYHLSLSNAIQDLVGNINTDHLISSLPLILNKN